MKVIKLSFYCVFLLSSLTVQSQQSLQLSADSIAKAYLKKSGGGALQIGIYQNGIETVFSYGEVKAGTGVRPDSATVYEIGQATQVFTSSLFAMMSIRGVINPDEPISAYLPVHVAEPVYEEILCEPVERLTYPKDEGYGLKERVTIYVCRPVPSSMPQPILVCYLGTHTSGLPQRPSNMKKKSRNPYANYSKEDLYEFLKSYRLPTPVGFDFHYTDLDMALLGHIMELKVGVGFERLLDSCLLSRCGMKNTFISFPENMKGQVSPGYNSHGKETPFWDFDIMAPAVGLKSTMQDMMKFLSANLTSSHDELFDALNYTHQGRIRFQNKVYGNTEAGLGWLISQLPGNIQYVWQEGVTQGFASYIGFVEPGHYGVVVLSNHGISARDAGKKILEEMAKNNDGRF